MIVGDCVGYSVAAARHRVHARKAKRLLLAAINAWPVCVARAFSLVDEATVNDMNRAVAPWPPARAGADQSVSYVAAVDAEAGRTNTDEPYLLPAIDPAFLNDKGHLREMDEIAEIIRVRVLGEVGGHETT